MEFSEQLAVTLVVAAAIVGSILIWANVIARTTRGQEVIPLEPRRPVPWALLDLLLIFMAWLLFNSLAGLMLREIWNVRLPDDVREIEAQHIAPLQLASMAVALATLVFAVALTRLRVGANSSDLGLSLRRIRYDFALGVAGFIALAAPVYTLQAILVYFFPIQHPLIDMVQARPDSQTFLIVGLSVSLVAPLSEEFLVRVMFQGWLERVVEAAAPGAFGSHPDEAAVEATEAESATGERQSTVNPYEASQATRLRADDRIDFRAARSIPIVTSALVFTLLHVGHGPAPIPLFFLALGLGYLYQRTHRLWPSVVLHFLLNTSSLAMLWLGIG
jgi:membrane protease YdiL (CAAX protease family)